MARPDPPRPAAASGPAQVIAAVLDKGSFRPWDRPPALTTADPGYAAQLAAARARSGADEAVLTGEGTVHGRRVAVVLSEFAFMAGSIGIAGADRITQAFRRATAARIPVFASTASGGTRMQEGTPAFLRMVGIVRAAAVHRAAGLLYVAHLRNPTVGGVLASWGSLGHVTLAEPGALVGFLGPRVQRALTGAAVPAGVQSAEHLADQGIIDAVVPLDQVRPALRTLLDLTGEPLRPGVLARRPQQGQAPPAGDADTWSDVVATRDPGQIGAGDFLAACTDVWPLRGTGHGENDPSVAIAFARADGAACVIAAQDRRAQDGGRPLGPAGLRSARRAMGLAQELSLPLVTVIDTAGADLSADAENGALSREIAATTADLVSLRVPTVSVLLGQGSGGGALALFPARRVVATQHGWLSPLPPEGASAILFGDVAHAADAARLQRIGARQLQADGEVHAIVPGVAGDGPGALAAALVAEVRAQIGELIRGTAQGAAPGSPPA